MNRLIGMRDNLPYLALENAYRIAVEKCHIRLDLPPLMVYKYQREFGLTNRIPFKLFGADERSRTADLLITNQLLYQLSYVGFI